VTPLRILHLMSCRGWSSDAYWAARIVQELERLGHQVALCCRAGAHARLLDRFREMGVNGLRPLFLRSGLRPRDDLADLRQLTAWLPGYDVVHVHRGKEHWLAALANRLSSTPKPLVRTRHIVQAVRPHPANRWLYGRATDVVVTVTEAIRQQYLAAELLPPARVMTLHGGVDLARFHPRVDGAPFRAALGVLPAAPLVGMISGLRVMKGHQVVVQAAAILRRQGLRPRFLFVGQGKAEPQIRAAIARAGLSGEITLAGFVSDLPQALAAMDAALYVPLESDGMSRVIFECLAAGRSLVATRVGAVPEILTDGRHALLVPAGDPEALASALARLLGSPELGRALGENGRELLERRYSGAWVAARLTELYQSLTERTR
jgi:glycosyltransferase involved in cell wall biosynthesis